MDGGLVMKDGCNKSLGSENSESELSAFMLVTVSAAEDD